MTPNDDRVLAQGRSRSIINRFLIQTAVMIQTLGKTVPSLD